MRTHDYIVLGAGPAGLQLGYYFEKSGRDYLILETGETAGTFFRKFPRHRKLISINKVHTGFQDRDLNFRWDWNSLLSDEESMLFQHFSSRYFPASEDMVAYLRAFAEHFRLKIRYRSKAVRISRTDVFHIEDESGCVHHTRCVIVATGVAQPFIPAVPGIEFGENYTEVSTDPREFTGKRVLIIGKGNSAFETADNLTETAAVIHLTSPRPLQMAWKSHHVGHLRAVNNNFLDTYLLKSQNGILDATIHAIERRGERFLVRFAYTRAHQSIVEVEYDRIIVCAGFRFDPSAFDETCRPALAISDRFPAQSASWESTNVPDLYFAGTLMQMRDFKKTTSGFIHGFRYNIRALYRILEQKYHGRPLEYRQVAREPEELAQAIIDRFNNASALFQQFGFLADFAMLPEDCGHVQYFEEMPVDYVRQSELGQRPHYTITLRYGPDYPDYPFDFVRFIGPNEAHLNPQLHPVVERYEGGRLVSACHLMEELESRWTDPCYRSQLAVYLSREQTVSAGVGG